MGHCARMQKHMTIYFGNKITAWLICHSCSQTFTAPEPNHPKLTHNTKGTKEEIDDHIVNLMIPIQINLNHIAQQEIQIATKNAHNTTQMDEDDFLMECAMAQEIYILDQEEQQYADQTMEAQIQKQNCPQTEWDCPAELLID